VISITLDWLAGTFKENSNELHSFLALYASDKGSLPETARHGYSAAYRSQDEVVCMWNDDRPEMGYHVILGGSAIRATCERLKVSQETILAAFLRSGISTTRLDLALDLAETEVQLSAIWHALQGGENCGTARTFGHIESEKSGETIYVGSRQSEKFIRIYNKAAQVGNEHALWYRFEVETKGMVARALAVSLHNTRDWYSVFATIARTMVNLPRVASFTAFFPEEHCEIGMPKLEKQTDREKWIADQVISAVAKHYIDNPSSVAVTRLLETLNLIDRQRTE